MATETQILKLDLDTKDFLSKADGAEKAVKEIADPSKFQELAKTLAETTKVLGVVATVATGVKAAFDLVLEAEQVRSINQQFEILTKNAGLSGQALKEALMTAADGLVDDTDLLKAVNEQVVRLGSSANKLPEIFELARNVTGAMGGDLLENFDKISTAIGAGNSRALKQIGIVIDQDKALRDYAKSLNTTVSALSDEEKVQAVLNATLERGKTAFAGINDSVTQNTVAWKQLKVSLHGIAETATLAFERLAGPIVKAELKGLNAIAQDVSRWMKDKFGEGPEQAAAHMERLQMRLNETGAALFDAQVKVEELSKKYGASAKFMTDYNDAVRDMLGYETELSKIRSELSAAPTAAPERAPAEAEASVEQDQSSAEKRLAVASKFEADLLNLRMNRINQELQTATTVEEVERLQTERKQAVLDQLAAKEEELRARFETGEMRKADVVAATAELRKGAEADLRKLEQQHERERLQALENFANVAARTSQGFAAGFASAAAKSAAEATNFAKIGEKAFATLSSRASQAFMDLGSGSKKGSEVMKQFMLNALADMAQAQGTLMLAMITNPAAMAAGAGLLVLAGLLRAKAGGGGEGIGATPGGGEAGGGGAGGTLAASTSAEERPVLEETRKKREVNLVIQGNYFETDQTKRTLMEMIRSETDATGFSYTQIGQGV